LLEERFVRFRDASERENRDRVSLMIRQLERRRDRVVGDLSAIISQWEISGDKKTLRVLPAQRKRLIIEREKFDQRIERVRMKEKPVVDSPVEVCGGVIRVV
jgi:hypothetical protein